ELFELGRVELPKQLDSGVETHSIKRARMQHTTRGVDLKELISYRGRSHVEHVIGDLSPSGHRVRKGFQTNMKGDSGSRETSRGSSPASSLRRPELRDPKQANGSTRACRHTGHPQHK